MKKIGVGVIGASPLNPGWAVTAHLPALLALPQYELRAVSPSRRESADAARQAFGVAAAYDNHHDLIHDVGVDLVVVTMKVTRHYEIISAALDAGKMVFSEWPLGVDSAQVIALEAKAKRAGVRTVVGLQGRFAPAVQHARRLVEEGYIGDVLSATLARGCGHHQPSTKSGAASSRLLMPSYPTRNNLIPRDLEVSHPGRLALLTFSRQ